MASPLVLPKIMLIAECINGPDFITLAKGELCLWLVVRIQMGILNAVLCFQTDPFDIVVLGHRMFNGPDCDMDNTVPIQAVDEELKAGAAA